MEKQTTSFLVKFPNVNDYMPRTPNTSSSSPPSTTWHCCSRCEFIFSGKEWVNHKMLCMGKAWFNNNNNSKKAQSSPSPPPQQKQERSVPAPQQQQQQLAYMALVVEY